SSIAPLPPRVRRIERQAIGIAGTSDRTGIIGFGEDVVVRMAKRLQVRRIQLAMRRCLHVDDMIDVQGSSTASVDGAKREASEMPLGQAIPSVVICLAAHSSIPNSRRARKLSFAARCCQKIRLARLTVVRAIR